MGPQEPEVFHATAHPRFDAGSFYYGIVVHYSGPGVSGECE